MAAKPWLDSFARKDYPMKKPLGYDAVIFDLFGTLAVGFDYSEYPRMLAEMAAALGAAEADFIRLWNETIDVRMTGAFGSIEDNLEYILSSLGLTRNEPAFARALAVREDFYLRGLAPRAGAIETLATLKKLGFKTGLISDCSCEAPRAWPGTPYAPLIDAPVFSAVEGFCKPDARIYRAALSRLGVEPERSLYVGEGDSRELTGAAAAGLDALLYRDPEAEPAGVYHRFADDWAGLSVASLLEVLKAVAE